MSLLKKLITVIGIIAAVLAAIGIIKKPSSIYKDKPEEKKVKSKFVCKILQVQCHVLHRDAMHPLVTRLHAGGSSQGCTAPLRGSLDGFRSACHKSVML